eukprot:NODE_680_length_5258_cov_0.588486.p1 type:complete len:597 gc:universal NODE_680_length_5258_cov_0.588486:1062-2852(+)
MRILIVNDTHLGFAPNDPIRQNDALRMFEYQLSYTEYDLVLHAGDLFDNNQPTSKDYRSFYKAMQSYCKTSNVEIFRHNEQSVDLLYPFLMIHGNHDEQTVIDMLASTSYGLNIGSTTDMAILNIYPTIVKIKDTEVAIYGFGYIRDERIYHLFTKDKVIWHKPDRTMFSIVLIHQNRTPFPKRHLPAELLPSFLNLAIWAHEHYCEPEIIKLDNIDILQPGSSVVTALQPNETHVKKGNVLDIISATEYKLTRYELPNRKFFYQQTTFDCLPNVFERELVAAIDKIRDDSEGLEYDNEDTWPIVKLLVNMTDDVLDPIHPQRLAKQIKFIANPLTCVTFSKKRKQKGKQLMNNSNVISESLEPEISMAQIISTLAPELQMLPSHRLTDVIEMCIQRQEKDTLVKVVSSMISIANQRTLELTVKKESNETIIDQQDDDALKNIIKIQMDHINNEIQSRFSEMKLNDITEADITDAETVDSKSVKKSTNVSAREAVDISDDEEVIIQPPAKRRIRSATNQPRKKKVQHPIAIVSDLDEETEDTSTATTVILDVNEPSISDTAGTQNTTRNGGRRLPSTWTKPIQKTIRRGRARKYKE